MEELISTDQPQGNWKSLKSLELLTLVTGVTHIAILNRSTVPKV